ncbi:class I SAM-dependent methyltransferase [Candidatus Woesearchaeota archaeon]|nr:class I SAM-dependent methyltransferase [Candidatus Woesearchaeota archaeon]
MKQYEKNIIKDFSEWSPKCTHPGAGSLDQEKRNKKYRQLIISLLNLKKGDKILDIGCGTGDLLIDLDNKYKNRLNLTGIDITPNFIKVARERVKNRKKIGILNMSLNNLRFGNNLFDYVFAIRLLHHINNPKKKIKEINKVLKDKGIFVIFDWCGDYKVVKKWDKELRKKESSHQKFYTSEEAKKILRKSGFFIINIIKKRYFMIIISENF